MCKLEIMTNINSFSMINEMKTVLISKQNKTVIISMKKHLIYSML